MPTRPTSAHLNPFAPPYNPIPPGLTSSQNQLPPFFFSPPPPPSAALSHQLFTYISPIAQHAFYSVHHFTPQNGARANPPPPPPPPPPRTHTGRGCSFRPRGGRGRGRGRGDFCTNRDYKIGETSFENRSKTVGIRHRVMPVKQGEEKSTVMIKNIPYDCPRKELIDLLDEFCKLENDKANKEGDREAEEIPFAYDFVYLPIDFRSKRSRGFAFVNFTNPRAVWKFLEAVHLRKWGFVARTQWPKVIQVVSAQIQGKEKLVNHFADSIFECETDEFLPACFVPPRDGSGQPTELTVVGKRRTRRWDRKTDYITAAV